VVVIGQGSKKEKAYMKKAPNNYFSKKGNRINYLI
jgi:hypothetical protein